MNFLLGESTSSIIAKNGAEVMQMACISLMVVMLFYLIGTTALFLSKGGPNGFWKKVEFWAFLGMIAGGPLTMIILIICHAI